MLRVRIDRAGYPNHVALKNIEFDVDRGELLLVVGPSGSGKSTLLKALAGVIPFIERGFVEGSIEVEGRDVLGLEPRHRPFAYLPQDPSELVLGDYGFDTLLLYGVDPSSARIDVSDVIDKKVSEMSSGQLQRLVAAAMVSRGKSILLLDEPLANLDVYSSSYMLKVLEELTSMGVTIVVAEHRVSRVAKLAHRVLVLDSGSTKYFGSDVEKGLEIAESIGVRRARELRPAYEKCRDDAEEMDIVAEARDLVVGYHSRPVLSGVDFVCPSREIVGVIGPNGCGKTTLLKVLAGVLKPWRGVVRYCWGSWSWRYIGWVPPCPWLGFTRRTVEDEVRYIARMCGVEDRWVYEVLEVLDLRRYLDRAPWMLSGGEKLRLALAVELAKKPKLLLLDEPLRGQDRRHAEAFLQLLKEYVDRIGGCVAMVTHDIEFLSYADRVYDVSKRCFVS